MQSDEAMNDNLEQRSCSRMRTMSLELPKLVTRPTNKNVSNKNGMFYVKEWFVAKVSVSDAVSSN